MADPTSTSSPRSNGDGGFQTILGFGSLLSEKSALSTFPNLRNFRLGILEGYKRVYSHAAALFFERGIARMETKEFASLCVDPAEDAVPFFVAVFEIPDAEVPAFLEREEEFKCIKVPYRELKSKSAIDVFRDRSTPLNAEEISELLEPYEDHHIGYLCTRGTDELYIERWGQERFDREYKDRGLSTIWNYDEIYPCRIYLRHCVLSAAKQGEIIRADFLHKTFLYDRKTTIAEYLQQKPEILEETPPESLKYRYNG